MHTLQIKSAYSAVQSCTHTQLIIMPPCIMKVVIDDKIPYIKGKPEALGFETVYIPGAEISANDVADADALVVRTRTRCNAALLAGSKVKFIVTATIGFDHIDAAYLEKSGIAWTNCPGCNAASVGQYFKSSMIVLAKQGIANLNRCTVGIVGVGHVGAEVLKACRELGCATLLNDPPRSDAGEKGFESLDTLKRECDVITFHVPLSKGGAHPTFHLAGAEFFNSPGKKPVIINASRGAVADNDAWLRSLESGTTKAAVIDTWENEPDINRQLLERATIATPHIAGYSADGKANATRMSLAALCRFFGISPDFTVSPPALPKDMKPKGDGYDRALQLYNPLRDTAALKAEPQKFEWLRGNYPLRREKWD